MKNHLTNQRTVFALKSVMLAALIALFLVQGLSVAWAAKVGTRRVNRGATVVPPYKITAIKALLFFEQKGTFSDDILSRPNIALWNTVIGEGDAGSPSNSTLVLVEVSGEHDPNQLPSRKIELTATSDKKVLLKRLVDIFIGENGKYYGAFWLYDTGCGHVKLTARIVGQSRPSSMTKTIPFDCGE